MAVVGFDFGTTNSLFSFINGSRAVDLVNGDEKPFPSVIRYAGEEITVGDEAKSGLESFDIGIHGDTVVSPKFNIGTEYLNIAGVQRKPVDVVADLVERIKSISEASPRAALIEPITDAVITIPVNWDGKKRAALRKACSKAGIEIQQFIYEPFAALYGYLNSSPEPSKTVSALTRKKILVVDWGGGTLDVSLCQIHEDSLQQIANVSSSEIGGGHFDEVIAHHVLSQTIKSGMNYSEVSKSRLLFEVEKRKIRLSEEDVSTVLVTKFFDDGTDIKYRLTRNELEDILAPRIKIATDMVRTLLDGAGVSNAEIAKCLIVGGIANMPIVRDAFDRVFDINRVEVPEGCDRLIAQGAAWVAYQKPDMRISKNVEVELARSRYLPLMTPRTTVVPNGGTQLSAEVCDLYCTDPSSGKAHFHLVSPRFIEEHPQTSSERVTLGYLSLEVLSGELATIERLRIAYSLTADLIASFTVSSAQTGRESSWEYPGMEFSLSLDAVVNRVAGDWD